jgi:hypothetical protein
LAQRAAIESDPVAIRYAAGLGGDRMVVQVAPLISRSWHIALPVLDNFSKYDIR